MTDLKELEKKFTSKKTTSALSESLSRKTGFTSLGSSLGKLIRGGSGQKSHSKGQITLLDEEFEQENIVGRTT